MGVQSNVHIHNVLSHKMLKDRTTLTDVEQLHRFLIYYMPIYMVDIDFHNLAPVVGCPLKSSPGGCSRDPHLSYIHI